MSNESPNDPAPANRERADRTVLAMAHATRRRNIARTITGVVMVAVSGVLFGTYFMQWYHYYPPNGKPWPMADLADSQPFTPWDFLTQGSGGVDVTAFVMVFLLPTVPYAVCGLLALVVSRRWRVALGVVSLLAATYSVLVSYLMSHPLNDGSWVISVDAGGTLAGYANLLMFCVATVLLII